MGSGVSPPYRSSARGISGLATRGPPSMHGEHRMLATLRRAIWFLQEKIGWNWVGFALSITIIVIAVAVLYDMLHDLDVRELVDALKATDPRDVIFASLCVAAGYFTLTFYDL